MTLFRDTNLGLGLGDVGDDQQQPDDQREPWSSGGSEHAAPEVLPGPILPHLHATRRTATSPKVFSLAIFF